MAGWEWNEWLWKKKKNNNDTDHLRSSQNLIWLIKRLWTLWNGIRISSVSLSKSEAEMNDFADSISKWSAFALSLHFSLYPTLIFQIKVILFQSRLVVSNYGLLHRLMNPVHSLFDYLQLEPSWTYFELWLWTHWWLPNYFNSTFLPAVRSPFKSHVLLSSIDLI